MLNVQRQAIEAKLLGVSLIPTMTNPLSKYWEQPDVKDISFDEKFEHALMTETTLNKLADYSRSQPTGCYAGKMWKSFNEDYRCWFLHWFGIHSDPNYCTNNYIKIKTI